MVNDEIAGRRVVPLGSGRWGQSAVLQVTAWILGNISQHCWPSAGEARVKTSVSSLKILLFLQHVAQVLLLLCLLSNQHLVPFPE